MERVCLLFSIQICVHQWQRGDLMRSLGSCEWGEKGRSKKDFVAHLFPLSPQGRAHGLEVGKWFWIGLKSWRRSHCTLHSISNEAFCYCVMAWRTKDWSLGYGCVCVRLVVVGCFICSFEFSVGIGDYLWSPFSYGCLIKELVLSHLGLYQNWAHGVFYVETWKRLS